MEEQNNTPLWMQALPKGGEADQFVGAAIVYTEDQLISYGHACGIAAELALLQSMKNLAQAIWQSHYRDDSPDFQLLDDCHGVLSQIDNMVTGLVRAPSPDVGRDNPESIRHDRKFDAELDYWVNCVSTKNRRAIKAYGSLISYLDRRQGAAVERARLDGYNKGVSDMWARVESVEKELADFISKAQLMEPVAWAKRSIITQQINGVSLTEDTELKSQTLEPLYLAAHVMKAK